MRAPTGAMPTDRAFSSDDLRNALEPLFAMPRAVRFQDVDAAGVIFFPRVLEYFHDAYLALLEARGFGLPRALRESPYGFPIAHAEADYLRPLTFGDAVTVEVVGARLGETSLSVGYRIRRATDDRALCALGQTVHVTIDRRTFRPCAVPEELRARFAQR
jgi:1,4-dihydroxy-2-naphthoyl-CoA hydrolase